MMINYHSNKYKNRKTVIDNITFDSLAEARRYKELRLQQEQGKINDLKLQPRFLLQDKFKYKSKTFRKIEYIADFSYYDNETNKYIVEDVKGVETDVFKLKMKLFLYKYNDVEFRIVK